MCAYLPRLLSGGGRAADADRFFLRGINLLFSECTSRGGGRRVQLTRRKKKDFPRNKLEENFFPLPSLYLLSDFCPFTFYLFFSGGAPSNFLTIAYYRRHTTTKLLPRTYT